MKTWVQIPMTHIFVLFILRSSPSYLNFLVPLSGSIARKQQAESVPNKNKVSQKVLLEQLIMGSGSGSGLSSGSGSGRSARQQRMKQRIAEGSSKGRNQIQNKRFDYTAQDKNIICGLTFLTVYALFRDMMKK